MTSAERIGAALIIVAAFAAPAMAQEVILVPSETDLQSAINSISDGGIIEIATGNTLDAPAGGFVIQNLGKAFTIRAETSGTVTLDGNSTSIVVFFQNSTVGNGGPVVFDGVTFANGSISTDGTGGVTVNRAEATFVDCVFENIVDDVLTRNAGAVHVEDATAYFADCTWQDNSAKTAGGGLAVVGSDVWIHNSQFYNNSTNQPNHTAKSRGAAIWVGNSFLRVSNSRFEGNESGYVGGAIFGIGDYDDMVTGPTAGMTVANSTFVGNRSQHHPGVTLSIPTEGGAFHAENQCLGRIYSSRFYDNESENGGAVSQYRAEIEIFNSVFERNRAVGTTSGFGLGGAVSAISNDTDNATTNFGAINRPSAIITVTDSFIGGDAMGPVARATGGIRIAGDNNRVSGGGGVDPMGTVAENRGTLTLDRNVFSNLDVHSDVGSGKGGGLLTNLGALDMQDCLVIDSDVSGSNSVGWGAGAMFIQRSSATVASSTFAGNWSQRYGGGITIQGSHADFNNNFLYENAIDSSTASQSFGAAIFAQIDDANDVDVTGTVSNNLISNNVGLPIFDDDKDTGPINDVQYNGNQIYTTTYGDSAYRDDIAGLFNVAGLNSLVVSRSDGSSTDKSTVDNTVPGSPPVTATIMAVPPQIVPVTAAGDTETSTPAFLAYAWTGDTATLDGAPVTGNTGVETDPSIAMHTLSVGGTNYTATVSQVDAPAAELTATPPTIAPGGTSTLSWSIDPAIYLDMTIDNGTTETTAASGSVDVSPPETTTYRLFAITIYGGVLVERTVHVGIDPPPTIVHTPVTASPEATPVTIEAEITDDAAVTAASLFHRLQGTTPYTEVAMVNTTGDLYSAEIGAGNVVQPGVEYYIEATDGTTIEQDGTPAAPHTIVVAAAGDAFGDGVFDAADLSEEIVILDDPGHTLVGNPECDGVGAVDEDDLLCVAGLIFVD